MLVVQWKGSQHLFIFMNILNTNLENAVTRIAKDLQKIDDSLYKPEFDFSLIQIIDNKVDGRGLWEFLNIPTKFADWIKYQIETLGLIESQDFLKIKKTIGIRQNGQIDYLLTVDIAKELAMLSRTERGKKARQYFIEAEKKLKELSKPKELSRLEILELALATEKENLRLQADLDYKNQIVIERAESVPPETMRITINRIVKNYAKQNGLLYTTVWNKLYEEFKYIYHIDLKTRSKVGKSKIQIAENLNQLENLYNLSLKMFEYVNNS